MARRLLQHNLFQLVPFQGFMEFDIPIEETDVGIIGIRMLPQAFEDIVVGS